MIFRAWRLWAVIGFVVFTAIIAAGVADHRSCLRQVPLRRELEIREDVLYNFLKSAAQAREAQASRERGQARFSDQTTADAYLADAARMHHLPIPDCASLLPSVG